MRYSKYGLTEYDRTRATEGFTIFSPLHNKDKRATILINMEGEVVKEWALPDDPGNYGYLLENGNLLVASNSGGMPDFTTRGGLIQEIDWDGNIVWEYKDDGQHHDFRMLANGNLIYLGWEALPPEHSSRVKGGIPGTEHRGEIWGDYVREVNRAGDTVWEWHMHDHLEIEKYPLAQRSHRREFAHPNTLQQMADGNLLICFRHIDLLIIVDKNTGKFIWEQRDVDWGGPHDSQELDNGNILMFANRQGQRPRGSKIIEFDPKTMETVWEYWGNPSHTFDSHFISGCQRLWSGNTLICEGLWGRIFEVTPQGDIVWEYVSPYTSYMKQGPVTGDANLVFRAYRYAADSPQIQNRV